MPPIELPNRYIDQFQNATINLDAANVALREYSRTLIENTKIRKDFSDLPNQVGIVKFCAEECKRQRSGELSVGWMYEAWVMVRNWWWNSGVAIRLTLIKDIGKLVEPRVNANGFRNYQVQIGGEELLNHQFIVKALELLLEAQAEGRVSAQQFYMEYEAIHPFGDGNGRSGKILFNFLNSTLDNPIMPENPLGWAVP